MLPAESRVLKAICSDRRCQSVIYIHPSEKTVECHYCGQTHNKNALNDVRQVPTEDVREVLQSYLFSRIMINQNTPKRGPEMVKVLGLSNYHCKLLSPLLTRYGMDKTTGRAKLLSEMNQGEIFNCSLFGDRAFLIEPEHISIHGYGKDMTGSLNYLAETLRIIVAANGGEERLIPIHTDGDGHCLVHAISRALVGRELFWHPLRCCLKRHFETNLDKYKELFKDFIDTVEWPSIIEECDPNFTPPDGELHGLRNIHIFGLANVLKRPIILLDSLECMKKCGDYSALFLPGFVSPDACRGKDNTINKPLCIAWSSYSHNHYIPLVGVQKLPLPVLPSCLIPKVWGMPQSEIYSYIEFDSNKNCVIGGNRTLTSAYIQRLVHAMEVLYYETNGIHPLLVADAKLYLFAYTALFSVKPAVVLERAKTAVQEGRLYRCLMCRALCELRREDKPPNNSAACSQYLQNYKRIQSDSNYALSGLFVYDSALSKLVFDINRPEPCTFCNSTNSLRKVTNDGTVIYRAEDKDSSDRSIWHYDQTKKYAYEDNISQRSTKDAKPTKMQLKLKWCGKEVEDEISCFDLRRNNKESLKEFVKDLSKKLIEKHFSDQSSDNELQTYVSDEIFKLIKKYEQDVPDISSTELQRQDSAKAIKLENTSEVEVGLKSNQSQIQYIKVVSPNGSQVNLALSDDGISYGQLQEWIKNEFQIPIKDQLIKRGVPPRPIKPSGDTNKQMLTDLKHGDRLIVEIQRKDENAPPASLNTFSLQKNMFDKKDSSKPKTVVELPDDTSWEKIKMSPAHFRRNGFMYKKIIENYELNAALHITLEEYPDKVFTYNELSDSIELCVKPFGHFLISSDLDARIHDVQQGLGVLGFSDCPLGNSSEDVNNSVAFLRAVASKSAETSNTRPLLRVGPGFSIFSKPDGMDVS